MIGQIQLTDRETTLFAEVLEAERRSPVDHDFKRARQAGQAAKQLFRSLQARDAIPENRMRYFADRERSASDSRTSRRERFLRNAHTEDAMYEHLHFWKYIIYFIMAPTSRKLSWNSSESLPRIRCANTTHCPPSLGKRAVIYLVIARPRLTNSSSWL